MKLRNHCLYTWIDDEAESQGSKMSHSNLSKTVLSSTSQNDAQVSLNTGTQTKSSLFSRYKFEESVEKSRISLVEQEAHQKRLRNLRKQLDFVQETAWKYQPVDKFIGH